MNYMSSTLEMGHKPEGRGVNSRWCLWHFPL